MRLLVDAGNTRMKWRLEHGASTIDEGWSMLEERDPFASINAYLDSISRVAVSTVAQEGRRLELLAYLQKKVAGQVSFYWAESQRGGLDNAYADVRTMGADRWHGMYGAWRKYQNGYAVVDAGSAITVDYVSDSGKHLGGYILPGFAMMLDSLRNDAARVSFDTCRVWGVDPGASTSECVVHGLSWLSEAMIARIKKDVTGMGLAQVLVTGGDSERLLRLGLAGTHHPSLVLDGLGCIDQEVLGR